MADKPFTIRSRIQSFRYAVLGVATMIKSQHNAWVHALGTVLVCLAGICVGLSKSEWCLIILSIMAVWTAEALNTAFEFLAEVTSPNYHPVTKKAKDVAAGAVLISAIGSAAIGAVTIGPYVLKLLEAGQN